MHHSASFNQQNHRRAWIWQTLQARARLRKDVVDLVLATDMKQVWQPVCTLHQPSVAAHVLNAQAFAVKLASRGSAVYQVTHQLKNAASPHFTALFPDWLVHVEAHRIRKAKGSRYNRQLHRKVSGSTAKYWQRTPHQQQWTFVRRTSAAGMGRRH